MNTKAYNKYILIVAIVLALFSIFLSYNYFQEIKKQQEKQQEVQHHAQQLLFNTIKEMIAYSRGEHIDYKVIYVSTKFINESNIIYNALENTDLDFARVAYLIGKIQGLAFRSIENHDQNELTEEQWREILNKLNEYANTLPPSDNIEGNFKVYKELIQLLPD